MSTQYADPGTPGERMDKLMKACKRKRTVQGLRVEFYPKHTHVFTYASTCVSTSLLTFLVT